MSEERGIMSGERALVAYRPEGGFALTVRSLAGESRVYGLTAGDFLALRASVLTATAAAAAGRGPEGAEGPQIRPEPAPAGLPGRPGAAPGAVGRLPGPDAATGQPGAFPGGLADRVRALLAAQPDRVELLREWGDGLVVWVPTGGPETSP